MPVLPRQAIVQEPLPVSTRVRLKSSRHQHYIRLAALVLAQLRSCEVQLLKAIAIPGRISPYAFEELLLTCCCEQGWEIQRNFRYSRDGGLDGRTIIAIA